MAFHRAPPPFFFFFPVTNLHRSLTRKNPSPFDVCTHKQWRKGTMRILVARGKTPMSRKKKKGKKDRSEFPVPCSPSISQCWVRIFIKFHEKHDTGKFLLSKFFHVPSHHTRKYIHLSYYILLSVLRMEMFREILLFLEQLWKYLLFLDEENKKIQFYYIHRE